MLKLNDYETGSRGFNDYEYLRATLEKINEDIDSIISGGARGTDSLAAQYSREKGIALQEYLPDMTSTAEVRPS